MRQNVVRSKAAASVMGMHVTLMLASAISRTRRLSLHNIVIICTELLSGARAQQPREGGGNLLSSFSVMRPQGHGSHVMTTIFLLPSRTLLLSNPLRAHHSASLMLKLGAAALDACTSQSARRSVTTAPHNERANTTWQCSARSAVVWVHLRRVSAG